jgi:hypothetical protein
LVIIGHPLFEGDHGDVDGCAVKHPVAVGPCPEDSAGLLDSFEDVSVCASAYALGGEQTYAGDLLFFKLMSRLFEPVNNQVGFCSYAVLIKSE